MFLSGLLASIAGRACAVDRGIGFQSFGFRVLMLRDWVQGLVYSLGISLGRHEDTWIQIVGCLYVWACRDRSVSYMGFQGFRLHSNIRNPCRGRNK